MPEGKAGPEREQARPGFSVADALTLIRLPLAAGFVIFPETEVRLVILVVAGVTDLLDGFIARRFGGSRLGAFLDPVTDKLFMAAAFGVVAFSGRLAWYEIAGVLARDAVATIAFVVTAFSGRPSAIPARLGGKAVTVCQMLTLLAFLAESPFLRQLAWATGAIALYAIWDYSHAAARSRRPL
ncbi:MAG TPA: CDP-alcohol phosphatidyltransferase family protein [Gemmatimonadales bacterium]|nr:CDP-alcohol phosphatidyltransferase family protein [Gemmatimonadales bacterium]